MKQIRRLTALLLASALLAVSARAASYTDVSEKHWAYTGVERASELGLIGGVGNGRFGLGQQTTRAEFAVMLCRLMGWTMLTPEHGSFDDNQNTGKWYYSAIETAYANGALRKLGANAGVNEALTREEMAVMAVRALGFASLAGVVQDDCPFDDVTNNRGYITLAYHMGVMGGGAQSFAPSQTAAREQAAVVLLRVYDALRAPVTQETVSVPPDAAISVEPREELGGRMPMYPRAPLEGVYRSARTAGAHGAVALRADAYEAASGKTLTQSELDALLASDGARVYRSARFASSYVTLGDRVVWFESESDLQEKVMLCRLMGVSTVYLIQ